MCGVPFALLLTGIGCSRPYIPAGAQRPDYSGTYSLSAAFFNKSCSGISVSNTDVVVDHTPGGTTLRLTYEGLPFDAKVRPDGRFSVGVSPFRDGGPATATIAGKFSIGSFTARVDVKRFNQCEYYLTWTGTKR